MSEARTVERAIIGGGMQVGKTHQLILESSKSQIPIMTFNHYQVEHIKTYAKSMGLNVPEPISASGYKFNINPSRRILVDEVEQVICGLTGCIPEVISTSYPFRKIRNSSPQPVGNNAIAAISKFRQELINEAFSLDDVPLVQEINNMSDEKLLAVLLEYTDIRQAAEQSIGMFKDMDLPF